MAKSPWGNSPDSNDDGWGGNSSWGGSSNGSASGWGGSSNGSASGWGGSSNGSASGWGSGSNGNGSGWGSGSSGSGSGWDSGSSGSGWGDDSDGSRSGGSADWDSWNQAGKGSGKQTGNPWETDQAQSSLKVARNEYRGVVSTINSTMAHRKPAFLQRWLDSLFSGKPFSMQPTSITILLSMGSYQKAQRQNIGTGLSVHAYTDSDNGIIYVSQGNRITVHGKKGFDGVIHASSIYNETTGTQMKCGIPGGAVRIITALVLLVIYNVATLLLGGTEALLSGLDMALLQDRLVEGIAILVILGLVWSVLRQNPRLRTHATWICLILLAMLFVPSIGYILVMLYGLRFLIGRF